MRDTEGEGGKKSPNEFDVIWHKKCILKVHHFFVFLSDCFMFSQRFIAGRTEMFCIIKRWTTKRYQTEGPTPGRKKQRLFSNFYISVKKYRFVFSVNLVAKEELNLLLEISDF